MERSPGSTSSAARSSHRLPLVSSSPVPLASAHSITREPATTRHSLFDLSPSIQYLPPPAPRSLHSISKQPATIRLSIFVLHLHTTCHHPPLYFSSLHLSTTCYHPTLSRITVRRYNICHHPPLHIVTPSPHNLPPPATLSLHFTFTQPATTRLSLPLFNLHTSTTPSAELERVFVQSIHEEL